MEVREAIVEIMRLSLILQELAAALGAAGQTGAPSAGTGDGGVGAI